MADTLPQRLRLEVLILRCQLGDVAAFGRLAEQYDAPARYYVRRLLGASDEVEDVVQETWLAVTRGLPSLRSLDSFPAWFYRIARNKAVERIRQSEKLAATCWEDVEELADSSEEEAFSIRIQRSQRLRVTQKGHALMTAVLVLHDERYPQTLREKAA